jgi:hypothetical protein
VPLSSQPKLPIGETIIATYPDNPVPEPPASWPWIIQAKPAAIRVIALIP